MTKYSRKINSRSHLIVLFSILIIGSGSAAATLNSPLDLQTIYDSFSLNVGGLVVRSSASYDDFDISEHPILEDFIWQYDTMGELLSGLENDYGLVYDLDGDQKFYNRFSFNESPLKLLEKANTHADFTYQCFERAELVALWAEQRFGHPPLILSFYTNDPTNISMNHSIYVFEEEGKWGYMSDTREFTDPVYDSLEQLANEWMATHGSSDPNCDDRYQEWLLIDLRKIFHTRGDWRTMDESIQLFRGDVVKSGRSIPF